MKHSIVVLLLALVVGPSTIAHAENLFEGKWGLNPGRSIFPPFEPPVKAGTRSQKQRGDVTIVRWQTIWKNGERLSGQYTARCDNRLYPVWSLPLRFNAIACAHNGPFSIRGNELRDGTLVETFEQSVSPDGRVLTLEYFSIDPPDYKSPKKVLVFDRLITSSR